MDTLESIKSSLESYKNQLENKRWEKQKYQNIASEITTIYNRMAADKASLETYRSNVKTFSKEKFDTFKGSLYSDSYKIKIEALLSDYDLVISNLDANMDRLNTVRAQYENKAYQCNGVIGYLQSSINSLAHTIENWVN